MKRTIEMSEGFYDEICSTLTAYETNESERAIHDMYILLVAITNSYAEAEETEEVEE